MNEVTTAAAAGAQGDDQEQLLEAFVGDNSGFYMQKWLVMDKTGSKTSWNWPAALITSYWLLYRKMYIYFLIYFAVTIVVSFIPVINFIYFIGTIVAGGLFGNWVYREHAQKRLAEIQVMQPDPQQRRVAAAMAGGTSWVGPLILLAVQVVLWLVSMTLWAGFMYAAMGLGAAGMR